MNEIGMDPERVMAIAAVLERQSERVEQVSITVGRLVAQLPSQWQGNDAGRFAAVWSTRQAALRATCTSLRELAAKARTNALAQISTSNTYGTAGPVMSSSVPASPAKGSSDAGFPYPGYHYTYDERLGSERQTGTPQHVMQVFENRVHDVFPFQIDPPGPLHNGQIVTLHAGPGFANGVGKVRVSIVGNTVTFTVVSDHYFDAPGSQISFTAVERNGDVYLEQHGVSTATSLTGFVGEGSGYGHVLWGQQAANLRDQLHVPQPSNPYLWAERHLPTVQTPWGPPIVDPFATPRFGTPAVHVPQLTVPVLIPGQGTLPQPVLPHTAPLHVPGFTIPSETVPSIPLPL